MTNQFSMKRTFLYTVIVTLVLTALMGIYVLLAGQFGETEARILLTTVAVSFFSMMSLACAAAHEKGRDHWPLSIPGIVLGAAGSCVLRRGDLGGPVGPGMTWKWVAIRRDFLARLRPSQHALADVIGGACSLGLLRRRGEHHGLGRFRLRHDCGGTTSEEWSIRVAGVLGILDACLSLCVPIVYRLGRNESATTWPKRIAGST